jgi:hypothetical protein
MRLRRRPSLPALAAVAAFFATAAAAAASSWTLQDQFGRSLEVRVGAGTPAVLIASDTRQAAEEIAAWDKELGVLPGSVALYRVANLKGIPFFVPQRSVTKALQEKHAAMPLLLDWKGVVAAALRAPGKTVAVIAIGPDGAELGRVEGAASREGAERIRALLPR